MEVGDGCGEQVERGVERMLTAWWAGRLEGAFAFVAIRLERAQRTRVESAVRLLCERVVEVYHGG